VTRDGRATPVPGFFRVDETAINSLSDEAFLKLRRAGGLALAYLQLLSMNQMVAFDHLNAVQQQLKQTHQNRRPISSLDEIFAKASSETLRFN
jgi:hypothetical protein